MIKTIGTYQIDSVYSTERLAVEQTVKRLVQEQLDRLAIGIRILQVSLVYVHAPGRVHFDFRDVASAQEDRNRSINLAEVFATEKINLARGNGYRIIQEAHGYSSRLTNLSRGESQSFEGQIQSFRLAPEATRFRLYIETLESVLPGIRKYVKPPKGRVENLDLYLLSGIYFIAPDEGAVVKRFGRVVREGITPGIHYRLFYPFEKEYNLKTKVVYKISVGYRIVEETRDIPPLEEEMRWLTGDTNVVNIRMLIQYTISRPAYYLFAMENPGIYIRNVVEGSSTKRNPTRTK